MNQCLSCKNQMSDERCTHPCLRTMIVCRQHARVKRPRLWHEVNQAIKQRVVRIQALWRGYALRNQLELAGSGVLKRSGCTNDEDLMTCVSKTRQHPLEYFAFVENGCIYWFDIRSILQWTHTNQHATNPYTRQRLSADTLMRLREITHIRALHKLPMYHNATFVPRTMPGRRDLRWLRVCQVLHEHNIHTLRHEHFAAMSAQHMELFIGFLREDLRWWASKSQGRRRRYCVWLATFRQWSYADDIQMSCDLAGILLAMLMDIKRTAPIADMIVSAYERADLLSIGAF